MWGDYEAASPCSPLDLPQTVLEPILVRYATIHGFKSRFDTEFISFEEMDRGLIKVRARDKIIDTEYQIQCKYLLGADGARSKIVNQLGLPLNQKPDKGMAFNILVRTDLSHIIENRKGNLHWIIQSDKEHPLWGWIAVIRMVKPWYEWMFVIFPDPNATNVDHRPRKEEWLTRVRQFIGDDSIPAEIIGISKWRINDTVAERYSRGNMYALRSPTGLGY
jgi:2-polyprenyl-6-methoxyphenol hydroxylase-like FAD-dependent oxidoreductase